VKSHLAISSVKAEPVVADQVEDQPSNLRLLGPVLIKKETYQADWGRIRFYCAALKDELELSSVLCQELVKKEGVLSARVNTWCGALIVDFNTSLFSKDKLVSVLGKIVLDCNASNLAIEQVQNSWTKGVYKFLAPVLQFLDRLFLPSLQVFISGAAFACSIFDAPLGLTRSLLFASILPIGLRATNTLLIEGKIGVDALDGMAATLMLANGKLKEACFMTVLISSGEYIRERTAQHCRKMVDNLLSLSGRSAWLVKGKKRLYIPIDQVKVGDILVVYPGELIPVDGTVIDGQAAVDQSKLTGEAIPIEVEAGQQVNAATVLVEGKIYIRCLSIGSDTKAGAILQALKSAPIHETKIQNYAAVMADKLVVPIMLGAGLNFLFTRNLISMMSMLIFDFSTGIRIAAPTAVLSSMYNAGRKGILVKNGAALERLAQVSAIVFDKTGTLTLGEPKVTQVLSLPNGNGKLYDENEIIAFAAAVEQRHHHPASKAVVKYAAYKKIQIAERSESSQMRGMGVKAIVQDKVVMIGSRRLMESEQINIDKAKDHETEMTGNGQSIAYIAIDGKLAGLIAYSDEIRPESAQAVKQLKRLGIKRIYMATGDGEVAAQKVAAACGITEYVSKCFPEQKAELVKELKAQGHIVAVIGDGINDSPALAHADIGFSLHGGTEAAREGADIVLTDGNLAHLAESIRIARGAINLVKENLTLAIIPNGAGLGLAAFGMIGPAGATLLNNGSAIVCALNSLRPLYSDPWSKVEPITGKKQ
jgi:heavy metal translocating P-type ATPase